MANDDKKDFNAKMNNSKDMPKIIQLDSEASKKWGGKTMAKKYKTDITPYWRTLKSDGEFNIKYPEAIELQKGLLEEEGNTIISKGKKNIKYYVKNFENSLIDLNY